ncbi:MAG: TonB-dependent receptor [Chitinophagaceae bacterium]|nr:TonB-dependent receptor [Chitinophagaceae bacterium]
MRFLSIVVLFICTGALAQFPGGGRPGGGNAQQMNMGRFYGKIVDGKTGRPVDAATITLTQNKFDSVSKTRKDVIITGQLTKANGEFSLEGLNIMVGYKLKISAIGYKPIEQKLNFTVNMSGGDMSQMLNNIDKDLGNIKLETDIKQLGEVVVTGEKPTLQLGIDRKIFNVEKNIVSQGGTGVDIMRNVPTVNVDVDGNVTLRNSAPQLFVDGRPTVLTLDQIPADAIQSVELITNPSAKYDASGGQSAIINIVLKKNKRVGYSGGLRAGIDMRARLNSGFDFNIRQGKINFFANLGVNQRKSISYGETDRTETSYGSGSNFVPANGAFTRNRNTSTGTFYFGRTGFDFFVNNRNTISVAANFGGGNFDFFDQNNIRYDTSSSAKIINEYRTANGINQFRSLGTQLSYKHIFPKAGKELTADVNYNRGKSVNDQDIAFSQYDPTWAPLNKGGTQLVDGGGNNKLLVSQLDYVNPINENIKWEAGLRSQVRWFESFQFNTINNVFQPRLSNQFQYVDYVHAAYVNYSQKVKKANFNYQIGLRVESSSYDGEQIGKSGRFKNQFPLAVFPSLFLSKTFKGKQDFQINYTRRVNRPSFFQLLPNTDFSNPFVLQTGNPSLIPEFTNSVEMSYQKTYGEKNNTFLLTLFGKQTENLIASYIRPEKLAGTDTVRQISTFVNASRAYAAGLELVFRNTISKWWDINYNANFYYSKIKGTDIVPGNERNSFFLKVNNTFKFAKTWSAQFSGTYNSRSILPVSTSNSGGGGGFGGRGGGFGGGGFGGQIATTQGYIDANYFFDLGLRKEFKVKKTNTASISINWSDIFSSRQNIVFATSPTLTQNSWRRRDPTFVRLNFSYRFGKFDVSIFKRKNNRVEMDDMGQQ